MCICVHSVVCVYRRLGHCIFSQVGRHYTGGGRGVGVGVGEPAGEGVILDGSCGRCGKVVTVLCA